MRVSFTAILLVVFANGAPVVGEQFLGEVAKNLQSIQAELGKNIQGMQRGFDKGIQNLGQKVQSQVHAVQVNSEKAIKGLQRGAGQFIEDLFKPIPAPARVKTISMPAKVVSPAPVAAGERVESVVNQHVINAFLFGNAANEATSTADRDAYNFMKWLEVKKALDAKTAAAQAVKKP